MSADKMRYGYARMTFSVRDVANKIHASVNRIVWYEENMGLPSDEYNEHAQYTDALTGEVFSALWYMNKRSEEIEMKQRQLYNARKLHAEREQNRKQW